MQAAIKFKNTTFKYDKRTLSGIDLVNLELHPTKFYALLGPSGAGKSTLFKILLNELKPTAGELYIHADCKLANVPHFHDVNLEMNTLELLKSFVPNNILEEEKRLNLAREIISTLDLTLEVYKKLSEISAGQLQRILIGCALIQNPQFLIMDEPFAHLDNKLRHELIREIFVLLKQKDIALIWATHDTKEALAYSDEMIFMNHGKIVQHGSPRSLYNHPKNLFVASSLAEVNIFNCKLISQEDTSLSLKLNKTEIIVDRPLSYQVPPHHDIMIGLYPEHLSLDAEGPYQGKVIHYRFEGSFSFIQVKCPEFHLPLSIQIPSDKDVARSSRVKFHIDFKKAMPLA